MQIEIDRALYLDAMGREPDAGAVAHLGQWLATLCQRLRDHMAAMTPPITAIAAE